MRAVAVLTVGLLAVAVSLFAGFDRKQSADVVLVLDQDEIDWPYHDAVRQEAAGRVASDPAAFAAAESAAGGPVELATEQLSGQSHLRLRATGDDVDASLAAADAAAAWVTEASLESRQAVFDRRIAVIESHRSAMESRLEQSSGEPSRIVEQRLAELEVQLDAAQTERDLLRPQIGAAGPAQPAARPAEPLFAALAGLGAAALVAYLLFRR